MSPRAQAPANPRVVACMPAYKSVGFIRPVLESLAAQTYPNLHILVSVDVCTDGTADLCERFAADHPNVTVIRQEKRQGWVGNSNCLLRAAEGDMLFFAFHDDPLKPTYVARLVEALSRNPQAVVAFSDVESNKGPMSYPHLDGLDDAFQRFRKLLLVNGEWWVPLRGIVRMEAVRRLGEMRRLAYGENATDWPWLLRLVLLGEFVRVPEELIHKEIRESGLASSWKYSVRNDLALKLAIAGIIRGAGFTPAQELYLYSELAEFVNGLRKVRNLVPLLRRPAA
jgi:glycosyltransferase involved in cell wall biosynthesis